MPAPIKVVRIKAGWTHTAILLVPGLDDQADLCRAFHADTLLLAGLQALGTRGRGQRSHLSHGPQAPSSEAVQG